MELSCPVFYLDPAFCLDRHNRQTEYNSSEVEKNFCIPYTEKQVPYPTRRVVRGGAIVMA